MSALLLLSLSQLVAAIPATVSLYPPRNASDPVLKDFSSFSLELSYFPDYAGNKTAPNTFSRVLLSNLKDFTGVAPKIRVGGTTQDHATYKADQQDARTLFYETPGSDQPTSLTYGPSFFESYHTWGDDVDFVHGFNFNANGSDELTNLANDAAAACQHMGESLYLSELGNEINWGPGRYRAADWSLEDYVEEWVEKTEVISRSMKETCGVDVGFMAPSFISMDSVGKSWSPLEAIKLGLNKNGVIKEISVHNYLGVNGLVNPEVDLQSVLMNHTNIVNNLRSHLQLAKDMAYLDIPFSFGETNSIAGQGTSGMTDVMGDALWLVDYALWLATNNIKRIYLHQGLNYRYASWQPIASNGTEPSTRPPYYGNIMIAKALGSDPHTRIANIPLTRDVDAAYAIYDQESLSRLVVLNMQQSLADATDRETREYQFQVPKVFKGAKVERLMAPGSDSKTNITFAGVSYDYELGGGYPVEVDNTDEMVSVRRGWLKLEVPASSGVLVTLLK